jgi:hypothetical protein
MESIFTFHAFFLFHHILNGDIECRGKNTLLKEMIRMELVAKSATYAMKGKQLLNQKGIKAYLGKRSGEGGCYYYIKVHDRNLAMAQEILQKEGVLK